MGFWKRYTERLLNPDLVKADVDKERADAGERFNAKGAAKALAKPEEDRTGYDHAMLRRSGLEEPLQSFGEVLETRWQKVKEASQVEHTTVTYPSYAATLAGIEAMKKDGWFVSLRSTIISKADNSKTIHFSRGVLAQAKRQLEEQQAAELETIATDV